MTARDGPDRLLTTGEIAERWRVSPKTVRRLVAKGVLRSVRIGRQIRFRLADVVSLEQRRP
jgi:excisionase family DNA binding protein